MIKYIEIKLEKYVEVQEYYINDNSYEWWNGGTEIYDTPVYTGDSVCLVVDTSSRAIGEVKKSDLPNDLVIEEFVKTEEKKQQSALGAYIVTPSGISIFFAGKSYIVAKDHINYNSIYKAVQIGDYSSIDDLVNISTSIQNFGNGNLIVKDGIVYYNNEQLHGAIVSTVLKLIRDDFSIEPLEKFLANLDLNPSKRAVTELYGFLEIGNLPITNDGCFLAYKKVRQNFKDIFTGTMDNSVGAVCSMPRNKVDDDSNRTCSTGLHVCSYDYLQHFGNSTSDTVVICKINPKDVVSIPTDYNFTKMRVCEYTVIGEDTEYRNKNKLFDMSVYNEYDDDEYDDDEYDDDEYDDDEYDDGEEYKGDIS